jgi:hypothetical protein
MSPARHPPTGHDRNRSAEADPERWRSATPAPARRSVVHARASLSAGSSFCPVDAEREPAIARALIALAGVALSKTTPINQRRVPATPFPDPHLRSNPKPCEVIYELAVNQRRSRRNAPGSNWTQRNDRNDRITAFTIDRPTPANAPRKPGRCAAGSPGASSPSTTRCPAPTAICAIGTWLAPTPSTRARDRNPDP